MKNKKRNHRNIPYTAGYTAGRNIFGGKAKTELIVLKRETALDQMLEAVNRLENEMEFTFDASCFKGHDDEFHEIHNKFEAYMFIKACMEKTTLYIPSEILYH